MKFGAKAWWSLALVAAGLAVYIAAVSGALFGEPTGATDIGLYSVTVVLVAFGLLGFYVAWLESKERGGEEEAG